VFTNNTYHIYIDRVLAVEGNLLTSLSPPINPPEMIVDPTDKKPADWVDNPTYVSMLTHAILLPEPYASLHAL
jgi:hypothetical protein